MKTKILLVLLLSTHLVQADQVKVRYSIFNFCIRRYGAEMSGR